MSVPTSAIDTARNLLADTIVNAVGVLPGWRVHRYPPTSVASPCIWVDVPSLQLVPDSIVAEWAVVLVIDGQTAAQVMAFDFAVAALWDALNLLDDVVVMSAYPGARDIGGPTQRAYVLTVATYLSLVPLCPTPLSEATPTP